MPTNLTISVAGDRPGSVAEVAQALGRAGINIEGSCAYTSGGEGVLNLLVEDAGTARRALEEAGADVRDERDVLVLDIEDRPGALGEILSRIADTGVNLDLLYLATNTRLVLGGEDLERARAVI